MSGLAAGEVRKNVMWRRGSRALALCAVSAALSGCYYYVPPSTQLACVPAAAPQAPAQQQAPNGCPAGTAANYVQTPGYTAPYYGYAGYGYPYYGYLYYGYGYGWPGYGYGYGYGPAVSVGWGWGWGRWGWRGGHRWR